MQTYLEALARHEGKSADQVRVDPYEIERLLELIVQVAVDILAHLLAESDRTPSSYRNTFELSGRVELISTPLAERLADAAGLRNVLVHLYDEIDYEIVAASIDRALNDFGQLFAELEERLE